MQRIFFIFILFIICSASTCERKLENKIEESTMVEFADTLTRNRLDSLFVSDNISPDIANDWIQSPVVDESKKKLLYKYVFIKELTDTTGIIYTLCTYNDSMFIINKRINK